MLGEQLADRLTDWLAMVSSGSAAAGCGPASTSTRRLRPVVQVCEELMRRGVLAKDTHGSTIRLAPPLVITAGDVDFAVDALAGALAELKR